MFSWELLRGQGRANRARSEKRSGYVYLRRTGCMNAYTPSCLQHVTWAVLELVYHSRYSIGVPAVLVHSAYLVLTVTWLAGYYPGCCNYCCCIESTEDISSDRCYHGNVMLQQTKGFQRYPPQDFCKLLYWKYQDTNSVMETGCCKKGKFGFQIYLPQDFCTARYEHKSSLNQSQTFFRRTDQLTVARASSFRG